MYQDKNQSEILGNSSNFRSLECLDFRRPRHEIWVDQDGTTQIPGFNARQVYGEREGLKQNIMKALQAAIEEKLEREGIPRAAFIERMEKVCWMGPEHSLRVEPFPTPTWNELCSSPGKLTGALLENISSVVGLPAWDMAIDFIMSDEDREKVGNQTEKRSLRQDQLLGAFLNYVDSETGSSKYVEQDKTAPTPDLNARQAYGDPQELRKNIVKTLQAAIDERLGREGTPRSVFIKNMEQACRMVNHDPWGAPLSSNDPGQRPSSWKDLCDSPDKLDWFLMLDICNFVDIPVWHMAIDLMISDEAKEKFHTRSREIAPVFFDRVDRRAGLVEKDGTTPIPGFNARQVYGDPEELRRIIVKDLEAAIDERLEREGIPRSVFIENMEKACCMGETHGVRARESLRHTPSWDDLCASPDKLTSDLLQHISRFVGVSAWDMGLSLMASNEDKEKFRDQGEEIGMVFLDYVDAEV